jgi:hypothetical protein
MITVRAYVGQRFNLGDGAGGDLMATCTGLEAKHGDLVTLEPLSARVTA